MSDSQVTTAMVVVTEKGIKLQGNLLFSTVASVLPESCSLLESHTADSLAIDMSGIDKIDSAGITLLLAWKRLCDAHNKKFQIVGAKKQAVSLITTNKLERLLDIN